MSVTGATKALGVSRQQVHRVMSEKAPTTPEMALHLGKVLRQWALIRGCECKVLMICGVRGINFNESFIAYQKVATKAA